MNNPSVVFAPPYIRKDNYVVTVENNVNVAICQSKGDAAFIVRCCNSYEDAIELLKEATMEIKNDDLKHRIRVFLEQDKKR